MNSSADVSITYKESDAVAYHGGLAADWEDRYQKRSFQARLEVLEECLLGRQDIEQLQMCADVVLSADDLASTFAETDAIRAAHGSPLP